MSGVQMEIYLYIYRHIYLVVKIHCILCTYLYADTYLVIKYNIQISTQNTIYTKYNIQISGVQMLMYLYIYRHIYLVVKNTSHVMYLHTGMPIPT